MKRTAPGALLALTLLLAAGCGAEDATGPVPGLPPTILHVSPDVLQRGEPAVLEGLNFAIPAGENRVRVGGAEATVVPPATENRLRIRLDEAGEIPCIPTRAVELSVTVAGRRGTLSHPLAAVEPLGLDPGTGLFALSPEDVRCHNLPSGPATYLVSLFNRASTTAEQVSFQIRGRLGETGSTSGEAAADATDGRGGAGANPANVPRADLTGVPGLPQVTEGRLREAAILDRGREILERKAVPAGRRITPPGPVAAASPPPEGELVEFRVPDLSQADACSNFRNVTGRVVHVSSSAVVVEDTAAPLAGEMDERYRDLAAEYESVMDPIIRKNFGSPLVYDDRLDDDGHFYMLFTPRVNDVGGLLAFVWGGDFLSRSSCGSSDEAELFYGLVPTRRGSETEMQTVEGWERIMRSTTIHEVKHIASFAAHRAGGASRQEESWLEEATAMVAEELYGREVFGYGPLENTTYEQSLFCELHPQETGCQDKPIVMTPHFSFLRSYLAAVEDRSPLGGGVAFLGGGWWLLRWTLDHAAEGEAGILRALTRETSLFGVENLEARAGRPFGELLADWTLALEADDRPDLASPERDRVAVPSWNVRSIYAGLHEDRPGSFPSPFPLSPRLREYGDYQISVSQVPGGSTSLLELTATSDRQQLLEILGIDGGAPPADLGFSILRVR